MTSQYGCNITISLVRFLGCGPSTIRLCPPQVVARVDSGLMFRLEQLYVQMFQSEH
jgi:hypothetical protein